MSTTETALTAHLVMPGGHPGDAFLHEIADGIDHEFAIGHATMQIEVGRWGTILPASPSQPEGNTRMTEERSPAAVLGGAARYRVAGPPI